MKTIISIFLCTIMSVFSVNTVSVNSEGYEKMTGLSQAINALIHKNEIINTDYVGEVSTEVFDPAAEYRLEDTSVVIKEKDKDFVILNLTDIHVSDYDYRAFTAFEAFATAKRLVKEVNPDLITVTGDIVCTDSTVYAVKRVTDFMDSLGVPWAPIFGNHDGEGNCDLNYLADIMLNSKLCLLKKGDPRMGCGNYVVNVAEQNDDGSLNVVESLIFMDTHRSHVNELQVEWYKWAAEGVEKVCGKSVQTSAWMHIPMADYQYAYDLAWDSNNNRWNEGCFAYGEKNEKICCHRDSEGNPIDNGLFAAMKQVGSTDFVFCGHEHMNNFSVLYDGIRLTYTMKIGIASGYQPGFDGGTVVTVSDNGIISILHKTSSLLSFKDLEIINTTQEV